MFSSTISAICLVKIFWDNVLSVVHGELTPMRPRSQIVFYVTQELAQDVVRV